MPSNETLTRLRSINPDAQISQADQDSLGLSRRDGETVGEALYRASAPMPWRLDQDNGLVDASNTRLLWAQAAEVSGGEGEFRGTRTRYLASGSFRQLLAGQAGLLRERDEARTALEEARRVHAAQIAHYQKARADDHVEFQRLHALAEEARREREALVGVLRRVDACETCGEDYGRCGPCDLAIDTALAKAGRGAP